MISLSLQVAFSASLAFAATSGSFDDDEITEAEHCAKCEAVKPAVKPKPIKVKPVAVPKPPNPVTAVHVSFHNRGGKGIDLRCRSFIDGYGNYGSYGKEISSFMSNNFAKRFYTKSNSLSELCPNFNRFDDDLKLKAWTWFWMVLANEESDCNVNKYHPTHLRSGRRLNPTEGWGMWAAELSSTKRKSRPMCSGNIKTAKVQIMCAVGTMADTQLSKGTGVLHRGSYWGPVRRYASQIAPNMKGFKPCFSR
jgi:hypothetical protein